MLCGTYSGFNINLKILLMKTGTQIKVDHSIMSDKKCKDCNRPLKENSARKGHTMCYVCMKVSNGKKTANIYLVVNGIKTKEIIGERNFIKEQKANIEKYKGGKR